MGYCLYIMHLIVFCTRHRSKIILIGEICAAAGQHIAIFLLIIPLHMSAFIALDFGSFWAFLNLTCVIFNDIAAYVIGKTMGKRLLTFLSPKKTVEGFMGAIFITFIHAFLLTLFVTNVAPKALEVPLFLQGPNYLKSGAVNICADIKSSSAHCYRSDPSLAGNNQEFLEKVCVIGFSKSCPAWMSNMHPFACTYLHVFVIASFASFIAPFGGLLASGVKRSLNRKDFGKTLGPHGGFIDRYDCKGIQCMLTYAYLSLVLREQYLHLM